MNTFFARPVVLLLALGLLATVRAQNVILAPEAESLLTPAQRKEAPPPPLSQPPTANETPLQWGPVVLHPRLSYRHLSADGLPAPDGRRVASEIRTLAPGLTLDLGEHWTLDYSPSRNSYTARALSDSTDHAARLNGALVFQNWTLTFGQRYGRSNQALVETARQTDQKTWNTELGAVYSASPKLQLAFTGSLNERYTSVAPDLKTWTGGVAVNYALSEQLDLSLAPKFSYTEIVAAPDYYGESILGRFNWRPTEKISLSLGGGIEYTHSNSASGVDRSNPLLNFSLRYQPFAATSLGLTVDRTLAASYFVSQATENLRWNLNFNQRLLGKLYFDATYSRQESDYVALRTTLLADRADVIESYSIRLSTRLLQRLSIAVLLQESKNASSLMAYNFSSRQYGIELGFRY